MMSSARKPKRPLTSTPNSTRARPETALGRAAHMKIVGADIRALDASRCRRCRKSILIGHLRVIATEAREVHAREAGDVAHVVARRQAMRVFRRVVEAHGARVVARTFDVAAEVALPAGGEQSRPQLMRDAAEQAVI